MKTRVNIPAQSSLVDTAGVVVEPRIDGEGLPWVLRAPREGGDGSYADDVWRTGLSDEDAYALRDQLPERPADTEPAPAPPVVVEPAGWAAPTPRAKIVRGVDDPPFEPDTFYEDCPNLSIPDGAKHFTVVGGRSLPGQVRGWQDAWVGGREGEPMNAGPRSDGKDLQQVKAYPYSTDGVTPSDCTFAFVDFHDLSRPSGSGGHPDGVQLMAGERIIYGGCVFRAMGEAAMPWFVNREGPSAGGGPVADVQLLDAVFDDIAHYYAFHVGRVDGQITVRGCDLGGKNGRVSAATAHLLTFEDNRNGSLAVV